MHKRLNQFFIDWYNGPFFGGMGITIMIVIYLFRNDPEFISKLQKGLSYDFTVWMLGLCIFAFGLQMMPIGKLLWRNEKIRNWFIAYEARRASKRVR